MVWLAVGEKKSEYIASHFDTIHECDEQQDGRTDRCTDGQTDKAQRHRLHLCIALRGRTRGQSNLTKSASRSRGAHSPVRGHPRGSKVVPLNSWGRVSY